MKILSTTIKILMVFLFAGALFFSCKLADADNGTLVISTENNSARILIDLPEKDEIKNYRVICSNEGNEIIKNFKGSTSLSLSPGTWTVTVSALGAKEKEVGTGKKDVSIIAGKTTAFPLTLWPPEFKEFSLEGLEMPKGGKLLYVFQDSDVGSNTKKYEDDLATLDGLKGIKGLNIGIGENYDNFFILIFAGVTKTEFDRYEMQLNSKPYEREINKNGDIRYFHHDKPNNKTRVLRLEYYAGNDNKYYLIITVRDGVYGWYGNN
jgi:hypothetical protein